MEQQPALYMADYDTNRYVDCTKPLPCSLLEVLDEFDNLSRTKGCFIGLVRLDGESLQFIWNNQQSLKADIPVMQKGGSLIRSGSFADLRPLIEKFARGFPVEDFDRFERQVF